MYTPFADQENPRKQLKCYHAMRECETATASAEHDLSLESDDTSDNMKGDDENGTVSANDENGDDVAQHGGHTLANRLTKACSLRACSIGINRF